MKKTLFKKVLSALLTATLLAGATLPCNAQEFQGSSGPIGFSELSEEEAKY